jgi:hypothetical protein
MASNFVSNNCRLKKDVERSALGLILSRMPEFVRTRAMKILQQENPSLDRDFKLGPPEYEAGVLPNQLRASIIFLRLEINRPTTSRDVSAKLDLAEDPTAQDDKYGLHIHCCNESLKFIIDITKVRRTGFYPEILHTSSTIGFIVPSPTPQCPHWFISIK